MSKCLYNTAKTVCPSAHCTQWTEWRFFHFLTVAVLSGGCRSAQRPVRSVPLQPECIKRAADVGLDYNCITLLELLSSLPQGTCSVLSQKIRCGHHSVLEKQWSWTGWKKSDFMTPEVRKLHIFFCLSRYNDLQNLICEQKPEERWHCLICFPLKCSLMSAGIGRWSFDEWNFPLVFNISQILKGP